VAVVETRISVWEALAGRAPGQPVAPADPGLWAAVSERINPARARPVLRAGIEAVELVSARGVPYVMLRSPDRRNACYLRLTPDEWRLAQVMDGSRTLARLVADFARLCGRLAPDQVRRVVADLAGNRMLEELPVDAFAPLQRVRRRPWPVRLGASLLAFAQGRRVVLANIDPLVGFLYRAGGRLLFTRPVAVLLATVALLGLGAFGYQWWTGEQSIFLTSNSYVTGAAVLLGLNVLALACHEVGHALATKHAGRRVPAAGFLVYFGIPSVFVDTTDVWMAGRRSRLLTTAAGPAAGLVLAGASSLVGLAVPAAAPLCFKLAFAWYLNALFNLNPFLALDGYYLLMDWLEVPNLRARGLAWVGARLRRRPPSWSALDREGRLVALYGLLALGWLVIAINIAYRVYVDRVDGLAIGLWRSGWGARTLLFVVIAALASPVVYVVAGAIGRLVRRWRLFLRQRRTDLDEPRRLAALRETGLRDLPEPALRTLASQARWVHPRTGEQLVFAGAAQSHVYAVVEGALEGRASNDPVGTVRERVGAGGIVGLGPAVSGAPSPLSWYTAGTTLLAIPSSTIAATVGPIAAGAGLGFGTAHEAEQLFAEAPALAGLSTEDRMGLAQVAVPVSLAPGAPVTLTGAQDVVVLAAGTVVTPSGQELGRGTLIGPIGEDLPPTGDQPPGGQDPGEQAGEGDPSGVGRVATARTPVRLFQLPAVAGLPLLLGASAGSLVAAQSGRSPGRPPVAGVHPPSGYPPLAVPPGPPPSTSDSSGDGRFERRLRWLLILALLLALLLTGGNVYLSSQVWAEMPTDKALLHVEEGTAAAVVGGATYRLGKGDDIYVGEADAVTVDLRSRATLTYRGGAVSLLCATTRLVLGQLVSTGEPVAPSATFVLLGGRVVNDTSTGSPAFLDLSLAVGTPGSAVRNEGAALFAVTTGGAQASAGTVFAAGRRLPTSGEPLGCGDGRVLPPPAPPGSTPTPGLSSTTDVAPSPTSTGTPSPSASASESPSPSATGTTTTTPPPSSSPSTRPSASTSTTPQGPAIFWVVDPSVNAQLPCRGTAYLYPAVGTKLRTGETITSMTFYISGSFGGKYPMSPDGSTWYGSAGPITVINGGKFEIWVVAKNNRGGSTTMNGAATIVVQPCVIG